jgi:hypothetical protein
MRRSGHAYVFALRKRSDLLAAPSAAATPIARDADDFRAAILEWSWRLRNCLLSSFPLCADGSASIRTLARRRAIRSLLPCPVALRIVRHSALLRFDMSGGDYDLESSSSREDWRHLANHALGLFWDDPGHPIVMLKIPVTELLTSPPRCTSIFQAAIRRRAERDELWLLGGQREALELLGLASPRTPADLEHGLQRCPSRLKLWYRVAEATALVKSVPQSVASLMHMSRLIFIDGWDTPDAYEAAAEGASSALRGSLVSLLDQLQPMDAPSSAVLVGDQQRMPVALRAIRQAKDQHLLSDWDRRRAEICVNWSRWRSPGDPPVCRDAALAWLSDCALLMNRMWTRLAYGLSVSAPWEREVRRRPTVLLVASDLRIVPPLSRALTSIGAVLLTARGASEGQRIAIENRPDLVLVDVGSSFENADLAARFRRLTMLTGLQIGALTGPMRLSELAERIRQELGLRRGDGYEVPSEGAWAFTGRLSYVESRGLLFTTYGRDTSQN